MTANNIITQLDNNLSQAEHLNKILSSDTGVRFEESERLRDTLLDNMSYKEAYTLLYIYEKVIKDAKDMLKEKVIVTSDTKCLVGKQTLEIVNMPAKYEFNDSFIDSLEKTIKERKEMLKSLTQELVDPNTGEIMRPATKLDTGCTVKISLNK